MREYVLLPFRYSVKGMIATAGGTTANIIIPFQMFSSWTIIALIPKMKPARTT
jgi:hypothetical protein